MKKILLSLLLCILSLVAAHAQTKSQVISDVVYTIEDFASDLSFINDEKGSGIEGVHSISHAFGSSEYFIYNGKQMESFAQWIEEYCFRNLQNRYVEHTFEILQKTFEKVDEDEKNDKRYRFDALLTRKSDGAVNDEKTVTFIVEWKGNNQYVSILEMKGEWYVKRQLIDEKEGMKESTKETIKVEQTNDWIGDFFSGPYFYLGVLIVIIILMFIFLPIEWCEWLVPIALGAGIFLYAWLYESEPEHIDAKILAQYDKYETVDSLKVAIVCKNGKWGLINYRGDVLQKPYCDSIGKFYDGRARAHWSFEYFYLNEKGESKGTGFMYKEASEYRNGRALVYTRNNEYVIIDTEGNVIKKLPYTKVHPFHGGYAKVENGTHVGFISEADFQENIPLIYTDAYQFQQGYAVVKKDDKWGVIDKNNSIKIPLKYDFITQGGDRIIVYDKNKNAMMDLDENIIIPYQKGLSFLRDNLIKVSSKGLMDKNGKWVLKMDNLRVSPFYDGRASICKDKAGYIDTNGKIVIPMQYTAAHPFNKGMAVVCINNKYGLIDTNGEWVIPAMYQYLDTYKGGWIAAKLNGKWGYINLKNEVVIPFEYDHASSFGHSFIRPGTASVKKGKWEGVIDDKGNIIIPCEYQYLSWYEKAEVYVARKLNKCGILYKDGRVLHGFIYDNIKVNTTHTLFCGKVGGSYTPWEKIWE